MIELDGDDPVRLSIKARPGSRKNAIVGVHAGALKVAVTAAPEKGKANAAIIALLAGQLQLRKADITILRGQTSSEKVVGVSGISKNDLATRLRDILANE